MAYVRRFEDLGFLVDAVPEGTHALELLMESKPDIVIADDSTPGFSAVEFLKKITQTQQNCKTIIITPEPVVDYAVSLMKCGAMDYLIKPVDFRQLELSTRRALLSKESTNRSEERRVGKECRL